MNKKYEIMNRVLEYCDKKGIDFDYYLGVAEMGYDDKPMICANWNPPNAERIYKWLEKFMGDEIELHWSDEWMRCEDCGKAVRSSPDSYGWQASWVWVSDCEIQCKECVEKHADDAALFYMNCLESQSRALPSWMSESVEKAGFKCLESDESYCTRFESGFHPGQNDTPQKCLKLAKEILSYTFDYVFVIMDRGQFDIKWTMMVRKVEVEEEVD